MANNTVTISGMFGNGKTYFADSPVVIDISGLEWPGTSPFNVVRVEIVKYDDNPAATQLAETFPNSNAELGSTAKGYVNSALLYPVVDDNGVQRDALFTFGCSKENVVIPFGLFFSYVDSQLYGHSFTEMMQIDGEKMRWLVETDSSKARKDLLLRLSQKAYGTVVGHTVYGDFHADTGGQTSISFNISDALKAIWSEYNYNDELSAANMAAVGNIAQDSFRPMRDYFIRVYTEFLSPDDGGVYNTTQYADEDGNTDIPGGQCLLGGMTEWERSLIIDKADADVSALEHTGVRNGDASTKPVSSPERVGSISITSWVDVQDGFTRSRFYPHTYADGTGEPDDIADRQQGWTGHAPLVLRDSVPYVDFLFLNRRGAVETCSGQTLESMGINVKVTQYSRASRPSFNPVRSLMAIGQDGRRSWQMSSGYVTREWAEWWAMEFLGGKRKQWWMRYPIGDPNGTYVPVIVEPAKQNISIYDRSKQNMPHVDFTVTLALEG